MDQWPSVSLPDGRELWVASRWRRFWALVVDLALVFTVTALIETAVGVRVLAGANASVGQTLERWAISLPVTVVLIVACMAATNGRTPGKRVAGLRVVRVSGKRVGLGFALWREVAIKGILFSSPALLRGPWSFLGVITLLDTLWVMRWQRRALHDELTGSRVVEDPKIGGTRITNEHVGQRSRLPGAQNEATSGAAPRPQRRYSAEP